MRTNSNLLITNKEIISDYFQHEHYRGIKKFNDTISLDNRKNISVFIDDYGNKLLMVIKKNIEKGTEFWDVEIEEIPVIDNTEYPILTRFIHAQYFVSEKVFKHIDYTINQYSYEVYKDKYKDEHNGIPIDQYTEKKYHYKVWCIEEVDISIIDWQNLVLYSLSPTFSKLFLEVV